MAMVKAFAYGSGSFELANILQFHRVHYLAVAYSDEGVALRNAGITLPIMVMNPEEQSFEQMIQYYLEPELYSFRIMSRFSEVVRRNISQLSNGVFPVHIKLDTGMHRLGFEKEDLNELIVRLKNNKHLKVESIFSHLAASEESQHDSFTQKQINGFLKMSDEIKSHIGYPVLQHILNSAGIIRFPESQMDMVRIGIGLHGIAPTPSEQRQMQTVATLRTTISQIKTVKAGDSVGYNRKGISQHDMQIAIIGIGYADGINRKMGNGNCKMLVNGKFVETVGNICMDMCMINITDTQAKEGDEVIVFGNDYPVTKLASDLGTIPYEILTGISQRVKRVYFHE
jgi:alanine racemase